MAYSVSGDTWCNKEIIFYRVLHAGVQLIHFYGVSLSYCYMEKDNLPSKVIGLFMAGFISQSCVHHWRDFWVSLTLSVTNRDKREGHFQVARPSQTAEVSVLSSLPRFASVFTLYLYLYHLPYIYSPLWGIWKSCKKIFLFPLTALWQGKLFGTDHALQQNEGKKML